MNLDSARKWAIGCGLALTLGIGGLLLLSIPQDEAARSASETIRQQTGGERKPEESHASRAGLPGGWQKFDPFTGQTAYWQSYALLRTVGDSPATRRTLLRSDVAEQSQIFLIAGQREELEPQLEARLEERQSHPLLTAWEERIVMTADGVRLTLTVHGLGEGVIAGEAIRQLTGTGSVGGRLLVIDAGGSAEAFDADRIVGILERFDVGEWLGVS